MKKKKKSPKGALTKKFFENEERREKHKKKDILKRIKKVCRKGMQRNPKNDRAKNQALS